MPWRSPNPINLKRFGGIHGTKPFEFTGSRATIVSHTPVPLKKWRTVGATLCGGSEAHGSGFGESKQIWAVRSALRALGGIDCLAPGKGSIFSRGVDFKAPEVFWYPKPFGCSLRSQYSKQLARPQLQVFINHLEPRKVCRLVAAPLHHSTSRFDTVQQAKTPEVDELKMITK